jgi:DNA topoisomerase-1
LTCEKCGKPLVIKWGKHGSFIACSGYPEFSPKNAEADLESLQKDIAQRQERARKDSDERWGKIRTRHDSDLEKIEKGITAGLLKDSREVEKRRLGIQKKFKAGIEGLQTRMAERRLKDRESVALRLEKIQARYPQINQYYGGLELIDTAEGATLPWRRNEYFCTYTRELPVDLTDVVQADLAEQGEGEYCENCGRPMVLKKGRFGTFYACTGYPDCKTTKQIGGQQKKPDQPLEEKCPNCGSHLVLKTGRFGEFTACSNYPTCKYVKQKTIGVKCPECSEGEISERRSKKGKIFYGCVRYPECKFVAWGKPVAEKCPKCGSPYLVEKWLKSGVIWQCPNAECKHKMPAPQPAEALAH